MPSISLKNRNRGQTFARITATVSLEALVTSVPVLARTTATTASTSFPAISSCPAASTTSGVIEGNGNDWVISYASITQLATYANIVSSIDDRSHPK